MKKQLQAIGLGLTAVAGLGGAAYYLLFRRPLPHKSGRMKVRGLQAHVEIIRDRFGVPHIYAQTIKDLFFAQGFAHAQDRLWQMDFNRRLVAGRTAEILGEVSLPLDRWMRTLGMYPVAVQEVSLLGPETIDMLEAFASGVNARIDQGRLPVEFNLLRYRPESWSAADTLSWAKMMAWTLSVNWDAEITRAQLIARLGSEKAAELEPEYSPEFPIIVPPGVDYSAIGSEAIQRASAARRFTGPAPQSGLGSNNWVISGQRTASGKPILANDMHLGLTAPAIWYENHLVAGDFNLSGVSFPGIPGIIAGHNGYVAWGFTNGFPDVQDLYIERLRHFPDGVVQYEYQGKWLDAQVRKEVIGVKGKPSVTEEVVLTQHGPIINILDPQGSGETPLALRWTALDPENMFDGIYAMSRAQNCQEFREALRSWAVPPQNVVYADTEGNIAYTLAGKIPIRAKGDGRVPVPGWTDEYEWNGYIPFGDLPHQFNPPQGYIVTANNRTVDHGYPYWLGNEYMSGTRAQRITELLDERKKIDVAYVAQMQQDQVSTMARSMMNTLRKLSTTDPELKIVLERLRKWQGDLHPNNPEGAVYEVFTQRLLYRLLSGKLGDLVQRYVGKGPTPVIAEASGIFYSRSREWLIKILSDPTAAWFDPGGVKMRNDLVRQTLRETIDILKDLSGPGVDDWAWGKLHTLTFSHVMGSVKPLDRLFNRGPYPLGGDTDTIWAASSSPYDLSHPIITGPPFRFIADLSNLDQCQGMLVPGQSGQPSSPHYADNIQAWFKGEYHTMYYKRQEVEQNAVGILRLEPS